MRLPNDQRLAREVPNIHIILGGHDHNYWESKVNRTHIVKSGSDFQCFSELTVTISSNNSVEVNVKKHTVTKNVVEVSILYVDVSILLVNYVSKLLVY